MLTTLLFAAALPGPWSAPIEIDAERYREHVRVLASDAFEGRGPATRGEDKTVAYLTRAFEAAGLAPAGTAGGWTQAVTAHRYTVNGVPSVRWNNVALAHVDDVIVYSRTPGSRVAVDDARAVFIGYGLEAPSRGWDDFGDIDLGGAIAVVLVNEPDLATKDGPFDGPAVTMHGMVRSKIEAAARHGAGGILFIHDEAGVGWGWPVAASSFTQAQFAVDTGRESRSLAVEGWLHADAARRFVRAGARDLAALSAAARAPGFRPVPLDGRVSIAFDYRTDDVVSSNVLAQVRGAERPDEVVVYTAHWDHIGRHDRADGGDGIYNGALDNATGTAALLEIARTIAAGPRPERTVVFIATTLEEKGLLGARYYAAHPLFPLTHTVAAINVDSLSPLPPAHDLTIVGHGRSELDALFASEAAAVGRRVEADSAPEIGAYFRSDHYAFAEAGIPAAFPTTGIDLVDGGVDAAMTRWAAIGPRYHQPSDEFDDAFRTDGILADVALIAAAGLTLANSDFWPAWSPRAEFSRPATKE